MKKEHTTIRNQKLFCLNCGGEYELVYPIAIDAMTSKIKQFNSLHKDCKPTWVEPVADQSKSVYDKAMFWLNNGEHGTSSKTIWNCLMGNKDFSVSYPHDPSDFGRCYKLLQMVPEWNGRLHHLKELGDVWSGLVDNWDKLTEYYENMRVVQKDNGMYDFMKSLGC